MKTVEFIGQTNLLRPPGCWDNSEQKTQVGVLPIRAIQIDGIPYLQSFWKPTDDEIKALAAGACVRLSVIAISHPMVALDVETVEVLP